MKLLANLSIRNKIAGVILVTTILSLGGALAVVYFSTIQRFEEHLVDTFDLIAQTAGDYSDVGLHFADEEEARRALKKLEVFDDVVEAHLYDGAKNRFVTYLRPGAALSELEAVPDSGREIRDGWVHVFYPVINEGERHGTIYLRGSTSGLRQQKSTYLYLTLTVMLGTILGAVIFAFLLQGFISKPILHLAEQAKHVSDEADYSVRVETPGQDEIGVLYDGFNDMLAQIQLRQEELERSNRDLDQFAYIASHDLKAPLRAIATLSRWLEEDLKDRLSEEGREQITLLRSRVQRMDSLIDGVLRYSRVGRMENEGEWVEVQDLVEEQIELLSPPEGFRIHLAEDLPAMHTKRLRLGQVFSNLINNAIKYHDREDGELVVASRSLGEGLWEFRVSDDGPGIPEQHRERVFVMFQTLQPRDQVESTGLGLSLVKKLVEEEGGEVHVESNPQRGATFVFTWPEGRAREEEA